MRIPAPTQSSAKMPASAKGSGLRNHARTGLSRAGLYALAACVTSIALGLRMFFSGTIGDHLLLVMFVLPIILSAYVGGLGPGLFSTAITALGVAYYVIPPIDSFSFNRPIDFIQCLLLIVTGVVISVLIESLHRARRALIDPVVRVKNQAAEQKIRAGFALALICMGGIGIMSFVSVTQLRDDAALLRKTDGILGCLHSLLSMVSDAETAQRGFTITGKEDYLDPYHSAEVMVEENLRELRVLTSGQSEAGANFADLAPLVKNRMDYLGHEIELRRREGFAAAQALTLTGEGKRLHDLIRRSVAAKIKFEQERLSQREMHAARSSLVTRWVIVGGGVVAFMIVAVALFAITQDLAGSRRAEAALRDAHDRLEIRVRERTEELQKSNVELGESERRYRGLTELSPLAIFINRDNRIVFINNAGLKLLRASAQDEVLGRSPLDFFHPDNHGVIRGRIAIMLEKPVSVPLMQEKMVLMDGAVIEAEVTAASFEDEGKLVIQVVCRDITERKQAEMAAARMAAIVESSDDAIIGKTLGGLITSWNGGAERMFGYTADEIIGRPMTRLFPPDRLGEEAEILERISHGEVVRHFETVRLRKSAAPFDVSVTISPIMDAMGKVVGVSKIARDITARKLAEKALREQRAQLYEADSRLAAIVQGMNEACFALDAQWRFTFVNDRGETLMKHRREEMLGRTIWEVFSRLVGTPMEACYRRAMTERVPVSFEVFSPIAERWIDVRLFPSGNGLAAFLLDINQRKQAEEQLRKSEASLAAAQTRAKIGNWELEAVSGKVVWSVEMFRIFKRSLELGPPSFEELVALLHPDDRDPFSRDHARVFAEHGTHEMDFRLLLPDGCIRWIEGRGETIEGETGQVVRMVGTAQDITERKQAEAEVRRLNMELEQRVLERTAQLEAANRELEAFSYSVSHDLRAPLRTVDGYSQAVLEDYGAFLPQEGRRYLNTIRKGAQQMAELIDDLLRFARLSRAAMELRGVDMNRLVKTALIDLKFQLDDPRVELRLGNLPSCVGDAALLRQVWVNLLSNAFKYSGRREKAVIEVGARKDGGRVVYFVRDNGAGFDMRYADKLFGVFQRLHRAEDYEGTGVGLAIGQRVVHRHGGRIWAEAREDQGATFYFTIGEKIPS